MARAGLSVPRALLEVADLLLHATRSVDVCPKVAALLEQKLGAPCRFAVEGDEDARGALVVPILRDGRRVAALVVAPEGPREWRPEEVELARGAAERTWVRLEQLRAFEAAEENRSEAAARLVELQIASTARERAFEGVERVLRENVARFQTLFDDVPAALLEIDFSATVEHARRLGAPELELSPEEVLGVVSRVSVLAVNRRTLEKLGAVNIAELRQRLRELFLPETVATFGRALAGMAGGLTSFDALTAARTLPGKKIHLSLRATVVPGHERDWSRAVLSITDVTGLKQAEERLLAAVDEKEVLLREVHHRVKNNLQVVSSLLNLQAQHLSDPDAKILLAQTRSRVQSMALIHERLYQAKDLSHVSFDRYAEDLVTSLLHAGNARERGIESRVEVAGVRLGVDHAIPCGFIVNELVTNSLKHAFPAGRKGAVRVAMSRCEPERYELIVEDDGVGLPRDLDPRNTTSLGLDLVFTFADQLEAEVDVRRERGTKFSFRFADRGWSAR